MTYDLNFRRKVFAYKAKNELTFEKTSNHFDIGIRTLFRWQQSIIPCTTRHRPATKIDMAKLAQQIKESPDEYQWERALRFNVTQPAITKALKRLNLNYKKKYCNTRNLTKKLSGSSKKNFRL
jgi:transposase